MRTSSSRNNDASSNDGGHHNVVEEKVGLALMEDVVMVLMVLFKLWDYTIILS